MGLLDDAIREHLELKRSHGAPDDEIARAEQEALGPARRDPAAEPIGVGLPPLEEVPGEELEPAGDELEPALADIEPAGEELEPAPADLEPDPEEAPPPAPPEPPADPALGDHPEPVVSADEPADDPVPSSPRGDTVPTHDVVTIDDEPDEVPSEEQFAPPPPPVEDDPHRARTSILDDPLAEGDEQPDVLEETPDFLQEAPEHDKLWFEQKPPRDFDFD
jgi:hypothetical protein